MRFITPPTRRDMPKPQLLKSVARRVKMWKAVLLLALTVVLVFAGLRDRENPVYPGVQIYSKSTGVICSAGIPVYPTSGGSLGFITASHCTDPSGAGNNVYQPNFSWGGDNNWAGFSIDRGTDNPYYEPDRSKPDAAVWVVANRGVSGKVPLRYCGLVDHPLTGAVDDPKSDLILPSIFKIGRATYCTGTWSEVRLIYDDRYSGSVYAAPISSLRAEQTDSGGIVFSITPCGTTICGIQAVGIIIGGYPQGNWQYVLIQNARYAMDYYGVELYKGP
ncbi:hypothetical protein PYWP30_01067 [Pyrobaculum sp. WP30]|nr:hypothetical protein PYWP30_01067 [Pyrobaculum sp. WP30]